MTVQAYTGVIWHIPLRSNFFIAPSKVAEAAMVFAADKAEVPVDAGKTVWRFVFVARASRTAASIVATRAEAKMILKRNILCPRNFIKWRMGENDFPSREQF